MLEQKSTAVKFAAFFTEDGEGKTGLTVTVDITNPSGTEIVTGGSATELRDGLYYYTLASGSTASEGEYYAVFKTTSTAVDQKHIPALWVIGRAGVEHLDADVADCSTFDETTDTVNVGKVAGSAVSGVADFKATGFSTHSASDVWSVGTRALTDKSDFGLSTSERSAIATAVWAATTRTLSAFGFTVTTDSASQDASKADVSGLATSAEITALNDVALADIIDGVLDELLSGHTTTGTVGKKLNDLDTANLDAAVSSRSSHSAADVWSAGTRTLTDPNSYKADVSGLATSADITALNDPAASDIATAVWGAVTRTLTDPDSYKADVSALATAAAIAALNDLSASDVWTYTTRELTSAGSGGATAQEVWEYAARTLTDPDSYKADVSGLATSAEITALNDPAASDIATAVWSAVTRTLTDPDSYKADVSVLATAAALATVDAVADAIKLKTDNLPDDPASEIQAATNRDQIIADIGTVGGTVNNVYNVTQVLAGGDGNISLTVQYYVTGTTTPVADVSAAVYYGGEMKGAGLSSVDGLISFALDNGGPYEIRSRLAGYSIGVETVEEVTEDTEVTIYVDQHPIGTPTATELCRVYEYVFDEDGTSPLAAVEETLEVTVLPHNANGKVVAKDRIAGVYDVMSGLLYWDVPKNAGCHVTIRRVGYDHDITVPDAAAARLYNLI